MWQRERGIYKKFGVVRVDCSHLPGGRHFGCDYFVLDVTHDPHALPALLAYADSADADGYGLLAADIRAKVADRRALEGK